MTNVNIREAHRIIKNAGSVMTRDQIDLLRSVLPPLPKQKTLEEVTDHVYDAWVGTNGDEWPDDVHGGLETWLHELHEQLKGLEYLPELPAQKTLEELRREVYDVWAGTNGNEWPDDMYVELETWLAELHTQLKGLKDTPATVPALPAGMRLADHEVLGRVVTSPKPDQDGVYVLLVSQPKAISETGADWVYAHKSELTFIDAAPAAPAAPAHPEFLETEADYQDAPEGTIVAKDGKSAVWAKRDVNKWFCGGEARNDYHMTLGGHRRVLRLGWGAGE